MTLIQLFLGALNAISSYEPYQKPRSVSAWAFVALCGRLSIFEEVMLDAFILKKYSAPRRKDSSLRSKKLKYQQKIIS